MIYARFWGVAICCLPFYMRISSVVSPRYAKDALFLAVGLFSLVLFGLGKNMRAPVHYLAVAAIPIAFITVKDIGSWFSIYQLACFMMGAAVFYQMSTHFNRQSERIILNAVAVACILESGMVFLNTFGIDLREYYAALYGAYKHHISSGGWERLDGIVVSGSFDNPNLTASFLSIGVFSFFREKWLYLAPLPVFAMVLCGGVAGYFTIAAGLVGYLCRKQSPRRIRQIICLSVSIGILALYILPGTHEVFRDGGRFAVWLGTLQNLTIVEWFFGNGLGDWVSRAPAIIDGKSVIKFGQLHNEYISFLYSFGLVGVACAVFAFNEALERITRRNAALFAMGAAIAANSVVHFTFHIAATACVGLSVIALLSRREPHGA